MPISVGLILREGREHYEARWIDPITKRKKTRTTGTANEKQALKFTARLEEQLNSGQSLDITNVTWLEIETRYKEEVLPSLAIKTGRKVRGTFNKIRKHIDPKYASALDAGQISRLAATLRKEKRSEHTIKGHLSVLGRVIEWAVRMGLMKAAPNIEMPKRLGTMKGRAIALEEFERMIAAIPLVIVSRKKDAAPIEAQESWRNLLIGLWLSGLRLNEAMKLHWTDDRQIAVDFTGRRPMMRIQAMDDKGGKFRLLPMVKDFAEFLQQTPKHLRKGYVFNPMPLKPPFAERLLEDWVSKVISRIGEKAGVKVGKMKFASAHDFRRAFGFRYSRLVMPAVLQELMRHASITTTMQFYVGQNAEATADTIWAVGPSLGNTFGNIDHVSVAKNSESVAESS